MSKTSNDQISDFFFLILNELRDREKDFDQNTIIIGFLNKIKIVMRVIDIFARIPLSLKFIFNRKFLYVYLNEIYSSLFSKNQKT